MRLAPTSELFEQILGKTSAGVTFDSLPRLLNLEATVFDMVQEATGMRYTGGTYTDSVEVYTAERMVGLASLPISSVTSVVITLDPPTDPVQYRSDDYLYGYSPPAVPITLQSTEYRIAQDYGIKILYQVPWNNGFATVTYTGGYDPLVQTATAVSVSATAATVTLAGHGYRTNDLVTVTGSDSTPVIDGEHYVTRLDADTFTVPVVTTGAGTTATVTDNVLPVPSAVKSGALRQALYMYNQLGCIGNTVRTTNGSKTANTDEWDKTALSLIQRHMHPFRTIGIL